MWMIVNKDGVFVSRAYALGDIDELVAAVAGRERGRPHLTSVAPTRIIYEDSSQARRLTGNLYVLSDKGGKQLYVGTLDECDLELSVLTDDCARTVMEYPFGYSAIWAENPDEFLKARYSGKTSCQ